MPEPDLSKATPRPWAATHAGELLEQLKLARCVKCKARFGYESEGCLCCKGAREAIRRAEGK